jgi:hypothetical protein
MVFIINNIFAGTLAYADDLILMSGNVIQMFV